MNSNLLGILKGIKISNIVSNTNKTLGVVKKIIPVYKEIRPYVNHEKSLFKKDDKVLDNIKESNGVDVRNDSYNDTLTFFH
ncbi:MAG: hypothetical protein MR938_04590 [Tenericutes bacterium]|nr:hypothetical protein [Mycoplasmatota bacterium]